MPPGPVLRCKTIQFRQLSQQGSPDDETAEKWAQVIPSECDVIEKPGEETRDWRDMRYHCLEEMMGRWV